MKPILSEKPSLSVTSTSPSQGSARAVTQMGAGPRRLPITAAQRRDIPDERRGQVPRAEWNVAAGLMSEGFIPLTGYSPIPFEFLLVPALSLGLSAITIAESGDSRTGRASAAPP